MPRAWSFGQKIGGGFAAMVALAAIIGLMAVYVLKSAVASKDHVITVNAQGLIYAARVNTSLETAVASARGFLLTREERMIEQLQAARADFATALGRLKVLSATEEGKRLVDDIERGESEYRSVVDRVVAQRRANAPLDEVVRAFHSEQLPKREALDRAMHAYVAYEDRQLEDAKSASTQAAATAAKLLWAMLAATLLTAFLLAFWLARSLARQIGGAVQHVQSSSTELQSAATQQASGARQQATAMSEISTTISELLATSRQIAESAQRVAHVAEETANAARAGDQTVERARESVAGIKRQVDLIVDHMLDLGKKSQQIGGILELINELAEQTNILAINATIEAAGAGESGKRFAVVADEIRKLADRVGGSTKEIRSLIEEIRAAVNTTVMSTESGTKAVDAGARQFAEVAASFTQIASLVSTTTEAAREIELSTKQQTTAVAQVNSAITEVAQTTKETEASSNQTLQTASQLTGLSRSLTDLIQPRVSA